MDLQTLEDEANAAGMRLVPASRSRLVHTVAFRVDDATKAMLDDLRATFPSNQWSDCFRWVLEHPDVRPLIRDRLNHAAGA